MTVPINNFTPSQDHTILVVNNITSVISFIALLIYFLMLFKSKVPTDTNGRLLKNLFISNVAYTMANLIANINSHPWACTIEGFLRQYSACSIMMWCSIIANFALKKLKPSKERYSFQKLYYFFGCVIPGITAIIPFTGIQGLSYGYTEVFCYLYNDDNSILAMQSIFLYYIWIWVAVIFCFIITFMIIRYIRQQLISSAYVSIWRLMLYPLILCTAFGPETLDWFGVLPSYQFEIAVIHTTFAHSLGLLCVISYGYQRIKGEYALYKQNNSREVSLKTQEDSNTGRGHSHSSFGSNMSESRPRQPSDLDLNKSRNDDALLKEAYDLY